MEIEEFFKTKKIKKGMVVLTLSEQNKIVNAFKQIYEKRYNKGFVDCARKYQADLPTPNE